MGAAPNTKRSVQEVERWAEALLLITQLLSLRDGSHRSVGQSISAVSQLAECAALLIRLRLFAPALSTDDFQELERDLAKLILASPRSPVPVVFFYPVSGSSGVLPASLLPSKSRLSLRV